MEARPTTKHERECLVEIITPREQIRKFFFEKHLEFLTSVPQQRLQEMILSSCMKGHSGKWWTMASAVQLTGQLMAIFWLRVSGMTSGWKKRKNARASRRFRNFPAEMEHLFYQH